jgi:hypothetical protein
MLYSGAKGTMTPNIRFRPRGRSTHQIEGTVVAASRLWEPGDKPSRVPAQRRDTPDNEKRSGRWESNPNGRLLKAYKIRRFVIQKSLRAIGVRIFAL